MHAAEALLARLGALEDCFYVTLLGEHAERHRGAWRRVAARLSALNAAGADVWYAVNGFAPGAPSKSTEYVSQYRAHYADVDQPGATPPALEPTAVIESSPGKRQYLWVFEQPTADYAEYGAVQAWWTTQVPGADPAAKDAARVLRLPGFANHKYAGAPQAKLLRINGPLYTPADFKSRAPVITELVAPAAVSDAQRMPTFVQRLARFVAPAPGSGERNPWVFRMAAYGVRDLGLPPQDVAAQLYDKLLAEQGSQAYDYARVLSIVQNASAAGRQRRFVALPALEIT
jgi:hypothetical protein